MSEHNFFGELKRRNLCKVAVAYAVEPWLLTQIATPLFPFSEIPNWVVRLVIARVLVEFPIALAMCELIRNSARSKEVLSAKTTWR